MNGTLKLIFAVWLGLLGVSVWTAPVPTIIPPSAIQPTTEDGLFHVFRVNGSIAVEGERKDCQNEAATGNEGVIMRSIGPTPWSVNQESVTSESICPEPLSSLCSTEDGSEYSSPFFEGDIVLRSETRQMIEDAIEAQKEEKEKIKERRRLKAQMAENKVDETNVVNDEVNQNVPDSRIPVQYPPGSSNRRVYISSSPTGTGTRVHYTRHHHVIQSGGGGYVQSGGYVRTGSRVYQSSGQTSYTTTRRVKKAVVKPKEYHWDDGVIPYTIDDNLPADYKMIIRMAMKHWERRTCVDFVDKTKKHKDYLRFAFYPGCWSYIGKQGGEQILSVGFSCNTMRTVVHEIGHAVGLWHEQSRRDRDKYIKLIKENIARGTAENFEKIDVENITSFGYPYDFDSVMHYDALAFTKNGAPTIKVKKEYRDIPTTDLGMNERLSDLDIAQINAMYECNQKKGVPGECFASEAGDGREYRGDIDYTEEFITCQKWSAVYPQSHEQYSDKQKKNERNGLGEHNYCRNPEGKRNRPWCFTNHKKIRWQYCPITIC